MSTSSSVFDADVDLDTGAPFLVMELLKGDDLGRVLGNRGAFSPAEAVVLLRQLALALDRTHAAGVVHRDLKPRTCSSRAASPPGGGGLSKGYDPTNTR